MKILVTGAAGFIGFHLCKSLLQRGDEVTGIDNLNDYYDVNLKKARLSQLKEFANFNFEKLDLTDNKGIEKLFEKNSFEVVCNLAAQAGVRYSIENPHAYIQSNLVGFTNILEGCRHNKIKHLVYASTSSVYGANTKMPFSEEDNTAHPVSLYAATKKSNELMAHTYSYLYNLPTTGLRFFTVYGPWGRPDMALFLFAKNIIKGEAINVFNNGDMIRDFTYVADIVEGIVRAIDQPASPSSNWSGDVANLATSSAPYRLYNIGCQNPTKLMDFINAIEEAVGKKAVINYQGMQPGDVPATFADTSLLNHDLDYQPKTSVKEGIAQFIDWYKKYYNVSNVEPV